MPETNARIKVCHDTAANFRTNNPTLLAGEWALETDTKKMKIGDGVTAYNSLQYSTAEESEEWQKPADWIDIRSGALPNSVYFLVAHSADYTSYPIFAVNFEIEDDSTYDVYVDGIKQLSAVASGTAATLKWQTLALTSGYDVTYPAAYRTHIVRITPTNSAKKITHVITSDASTWTTKLGCLWAHVELDYSANFRQAFGDTVYHSTYLLEAITAKDGVIKATSVSQIVGGAPNLKTLPILDLEDSNGASISYISYDNRNNFLKKIHIKNLHQTGAVTNSNLFRQHNALEEFVLENSTMCVSPNTFGAVEMPSLKKLPEGIYYGSTGELRIGDGGGLPMLQDTFLDLSSKTDLPRLRVQGTSSHRNDGIKGLTVSNQAPFSGSSPQINVSYTGLDRAALVTLFNSMPTVTDSQVCDVTSCVGSGNLTPDDLAIANAKGWTITR